MSGLSITWHFAPSADPEGWRRRHTEGDAPSELPYGIEHLAKHATTVQWRTTRPLGITGNVRLSLGLRGPGRNANPESVDLSWDESNVPRMLAEGDSARRFSGVIWLTDPAGTASDRARRILQLRALKTLDGVWCLSRAQIPLLRDALRWQEGRISFLRFGIDEAFFRFFPYDNAHGILSVGNDRHRDPRTLLEALTTVHRARPQVPLRVQTNHAGPLPPGVVRLPRMSHGALRSEYQRASVVAVATRPNSHVSGMTAALEAGATGRPVVMTRTASVEDYVVDGETGLFAAPGDSVSLAHRLIDLIDARETGANMGARAREKVESEHRVTQMMDSLAALMLNGGT